MSLTASVVSLGITLRRMAKPYKRGPLLGMIEVAPRRRGYGAHHTPSSAA
jgi:hypothetical protein